MKAQTTDTRSGCLCAHRFFICPRIRRKEKMKGKTTCPKVVELRVEMNRKVPLSLASDSRELQFRWGLWGGFGASRRLGSCWLGSGSPQGQSQAWNGFCVHKISLCKGTGGEMGQWQQGNYPITAGSTVLNLGPSPQDYPSLLRGWVSLHPCSFPLLFLSPVLSRQ